MYIFCREENWLPFQWINYHETAEEWEMINTGHTASIKVTTEDCKGFPRVSTNMIQYKIDILCKIHLPYLGISRRITRHFPTK